ncbi:MAG: M36 family metallopeptidase, partial [Thermoanaerobaculia bacterium]|nr:M36 family metallopeptidase [Thermoanaerobaculia bacterium]
FKATSRLIAGTLLLASAFPLLAETSATFLTGPQAGDPVDLALAYVRGHAADYGLTAEDLIDVEITDQYQTRHNGVTHVYLRQRHGSVPVFNGAINVNVARNGVIINVGSRFVSNLASMVNAVAPSISQEEAVLGAADHLAIPATEATLVRIETLGGPTLGARFEGGAISQDEIPVQLMYQPMEDGSVRLSWRLVVNELRNSNWWDLRVDALSGEVLSKNNWTQEHGSVSSSPTYDVIPIPAESPDDTGVAQVTVDNPADLTASPFGWHDDDGTGANDYTDTRGNNVWAQDDLDTNNAGGVRPDGGAGHIFAHVWDPGLDPTAGTNLEASIVNLFYYNNIMHDVAYQYGFDEAGGNFQQNNYGNGGVGNDPVDADAQDGFDTNNANFTTPPDGSRPRMQMFRWVDPFGQVVTVNSPGSIAGDYPANQSNNGGTANGLTADIAIAEDGVGLPNDACEAVSNDLTGKIALILWNQGACNSSVFIVNVANAGAVAAIIIDNTPLPRTSFGGSALIPSVAVGQADGQLIMSTILGATTVNASIDDNPSSVDRDSDLDNGIIAHEYGHGISNRLVGGPSNTNCLFGDERMGEGWSDFWALLLTPRAGDSPFTARGIGNYVVFDTPSGPGIRNFPYTVDMSINPETYADIGTALVPHGVGSIWMQMLWEVHWELVARYGFDPDLYTGTGGNNLLIQLVVDGMKLAPCGPTFLTARDAILSADDVLTGNGSAGSGLNQCEIWRGFAKRGAGVAAVSGGTGVGTEVEDYSIPVGCSAATNYIWDNGFESGDTTAWSSSTP